MSKNPKNPGGQKCSACKGSGLADNAQRVATRTTPKSGGFPIEAVPSIAPPGLCTACDGTGGLSGWSQ